MKIKILLRQFQIFIAKIAIFFNLNFVYSCILIFSGKWVFCGRHRNIFSPKVIVFSRAGGNEDIKKIVGKTNLDLILIFAPRALIKLLFSHFFPGGELSDATYRPGEFSEVKSTYQFRWVKILTYLHSYFNLRGLIGFNIVYYAEKEISNACKLLGLRFICIQKEGLRPLATNKIWENHLRSDHEPTGYSLICSYNERTWSAILESGIAPYAEHVVTGCPRIDDLIRSGMRRSDLVSAERKPTIIYFMIQPSAGTPIHETGYAFLFDELSREVTKCFLDFAQENPEINFLFKGKIGFSLYNNGLVHNQADRLALENVDFQFEGTVEDIDMSSVVASFGFNTMCLLETVALGIPTYSVCFSELVDPDNEFCLDIAAPIVGITSRASLIESLESAKNGSQKSIDSSNKDQLLERFLGNSDGFAADRLAAALTVHLNKPGR